MVPHTHSPSLQGKLSGKPNTISSSSSSKAFILQNKLPEIPPLVPPPLLPNNSPSFYDRKERMKCLFWYPLSFFFVTSSSSTSAKCLHCFRLLMMVFERWDLLLLLFLRNRGDGPLEFWGLRGGLLVHIVCTLLQWDPEAGGRGVFITLTLLRAQVWRNV